MLKERSLVALFVAGRTKISDTNVQTCETSTLWMGVRSLRYTTTHCRVYFPLNLGRFWDIISKCSLNQGCRDISRYAIYRDIFYVSRYAIYRDIFLVILQYKRTWIYGDRRKNRRRKTEIYEQSFSSTFEFSCGAAYIYTVNYPPPLKFSRPCKY